MDNKGGRNIEESRLKWYSHVLRREEEYVGKRAMVMEVPGKRKRVQPKRRWLDDINNDLSERELSEEEARGIWVPWFHLSYVWTIRSTLRPMLPSGSDVSRDGGGKVRM